MIEFNAGSWGGQFSEPIIDVKEVIVREKNIVQLRKPYSEKWLKGVCLISSNDPDDKRKILNVRHILEKLKQFGKELEVYGATKIISE